MRWREKGDRRREIKRARKRWAREERGRHGEMKVEANRVSERE